MGMLWWESSGRVGSWRERKGLETVSHLAREESQGTSLQSKWSSSKLVSYYGGEKTAHGWSQQGQGCT